MGLYQKHRPPTFEGFYGNRNLIITLKGLFKTPEKLPHAFLFTGESGCGKTTLARIIAEQLNCSQHNLIEVDTAQFTGIDTVRDIRKSSQFTPLGGGVRVFIIDECFSRGTQIETPNGKKNIEDIAIGDSIISMAGKDIVTNVFINKVPLERVMLLKFDNGSVLCCSKDHLFFTKNGWVKACLLNKNSLLLPLVSQSMNDISKQTKITSHETQESKILPNVQQTFNKESKNSVFKQMFCTIKRTCENVFNSYRNTRMCYLQETNIVLFGQTGEIQYKNMQPGMWKQIGRVTPNWIEKIRRFLQGTIYSPEGIFKHNRTGKITKTGFLTTNEGKQSIKQPENNIKGEGNKTNKWDIECVERGSWWKWAFNRTTNIIGNIFRLENGSSNTYRKQSKRWFWLPNLLQSRFGKRKFENSNRNRWEWSQIERKYSERFEENRKADFVRLESAAFYKRGSNDEYFKGIIEDQERNQGFVNFYDLKVQTHPSYFANGMTVHNCHKLSTEAQNAFLKILEDTPPHVYFILCTTNENNLLPTIKGRCSRFQVSLLTDGEMAALVTDIAEKEGETLEEEVIEQIVISGQGHPRDTINILEQVLATPARKRLAAAQKSQILQTEGKELCQALLKNSNWKTVSAILRGLKEQEPEGVRRIVLGYMSAVLLNTDNQQAGLILECFEEPFYNIGFPGLVLACYKVVKG